ncbi:MAG: PIN domain-containing protein [Gemmatimonadaceae bacterium]
MSVLTLAEIRYGIELLPPGQQRDQLTNWFSRELLEQFKGRILDVNANVADAWGIISARARQSSRHLLAADALLLATAMVHSLAVVTRNVRHFSGYDVHVINPWEPDQA